MIIKLIFFPLYMRDENWMRQLNTLDFYIKNTSYDEVYQLYIKPLHVAYYG